MDVLFQSLGEHLVHEAEASNEDVLLAAPFIKRDALRRIIESISNSCSLTVVTRWHLSEIAAGASDPGIWELLKDGSRRSLKLLSNLHAKYYRFDDVCLAGSANLTGTALGWSAKPNLEFLTRFPARNVEPFEEALSDAVLATESMYQHLLRMLEEYEEKHPDMTEKDEYLLDPVEVMGTVQDSRSEFDAAPSLHESWWVPKLRHPHDLYWIYVGDVEAVTSVTRKHAEHDLRFFELPSGLDRETFNMEVGWQLLQKPVVQEIDEFVTTSRRFGAVRDLLRDLPCAKDPDFDPTDAWQTLMRWLLYFLEDRYRRYEADYSEIFVRKEGIER